MSNEYRPKNIDNYIIEDSVKENVKIIIDSSIKQGKTIDHIIIYGPPGLGKTTLANIVSNEVNKDIKIISAPNIEKIADIVTILANLEEGDILFIDEIHQMKLSFEESIYSAMEDFKVDIIVGEGINAKAITIPIEKFTLIGATTKLANLSKPFRDRFGIKIKLDFYSNDKLSKIIKNISEKDSIKITKEAVEILSISSRGTPRIAINLYKRVKDYYFYKNKSVIDKELVENTLLKIGIHKDGLEISDIKYLEIFKEQNRPVGIKTISNILNEDQKTIEDMIEPFLIKEGYISKTSNGRIITEKGRSYLNL